jgi:hypothetical protein
MKILMKPMFARLMVAYIALCSVGVCADAPKFGLAADNKIFAQKLVNQIMIANPTLLTAGMHCVPPGGDRQTIIASTLDVIGKPSDPEDVDVGAKGFTQINPNLKIPKLGIMLPLHDRSGKLIGAFALAFKYREGEDQVKYFAEATAIRDRVAKGIPSLADLFATTP